MKTGFDNDLVASPHRSIAGLWYIRERLRFYLGDDYPKGAYIEVCVGALTNGASVPWLLTFIYPRWHPFYALAAALHDGLVGEHGQVKAMLYVPGLAPREVSWAEAALIFKQAMKHGNTPHWLRSQFYHAVMLFKRIKKLKRFFGVG